MKVGSTVFGVLVAFTVLCPVQAIESEKPSVDKPKDEWASTNPKNVLRLTNLLKERRIDPTLTGVTKYLIAAAPSPERSARVNELVQQLGAEGFRERRAAERELSTILPQARNALAAAVTGGDPEIRSRAKKLLARAENDLTHENVLVCLEWLAAAQRKGGAAAVIGVLPRCAEESDFAQAREALRATVQNNDVDLLWKAVKGSNSIVRRAAITALPEILPPAKSDQLHPCLKDKKEDICFAVAVALVNLKDRRGLAALVDLLSAKDTEIQIASHRALNTITGQDHELPLQEKVGDGLRAPS